MSHRPISIIGVGGGAGTGKDWLVTNVFQPLGYLGVGFADHFKIELIGRGEMTFEEAFFNPKSARVRDRLQQRGTEEGRDVYGENVWVNTLFADLQRIALRWGFTKFVTTDCRFMNEISCVQQRGGYVYRIDAPERYAANGMRPEERVHRSERLMGSDEFNHLFDGVIDNDPAVQDTTIYRTTRLLKSHGIIT